MRNFLKSLVTVIFTAEARAVVKKYRPGIIAITGSVGKTSTKDAIYAALSEHASVRKSEKSFNSELGLPLTIIGCPNAWNSPLKWLENIFDGLMLILFKSSYPDWLVLEIGADRPGDIRNVAAWLPVDIAVITRLPEVPVHVEYFSSPEAVIEEKAAIIRALKPGGTLILYADDTRTRDDLAKRAPASVHVATFGFDESATVRGSDLAIDYSEGAEGKPVFPVGMGARITLKDKSVEAHTKGNIGKPALLPLLAAAAVGAAFDLPLSDSIQSFERNYVPPPGRMRLIPGVKDTLLIDDTYNASPAATTAALETLRDIKVPGRKIAMLGDMLELGRFSVEEHKKIGVLAASIVDMLVTVGFRARNIADAALDSELPDSVIFQYEDAWKAGEEIVDIIKPGDCILLKGSQSIRMEHATESLMAEAIEANKLLVRQDEEWQKR